MAVGRMGRGFALRALGALAWSVCLPCAAIFAGSPVDQPPEYCTAFNHFPKSGGSSVKAQLSRSTRDGHSRRAGLVTGMIRTTPESRLDIISNSSVIVGYVEMLRIPLQDAGRECDFFTMIRDPIDRLVSAFYFCPGNLAYPHHRPQKWCGNAEGQTESLQDRLLEFAKETWGNTAFRLMMQSFVCEPRFELCRPDLVSKVRSWPHNIDTPEGQEMMDNVKQVLSTYTAVGILEEWELSMELFNAKVKSPVGQWNASVAANKNTRSSERQTLLDWAHQSPELDMRLAADKLLYQHAVATFRQQTTDTLNVEWTD